MTERDFVLYLAGYFELAGYPADGFTFEHLQIIKTRLQEIKRKERSDFYAQVEQNLEDTHEVFRLVSEYYEAHIAPRRSAITAGADAIRKGIGTLTKGLIS